MEIGDRAKVRIPVRVIKEYRNEVFYEDEYHILDYDVISSGGICPKCGSEIEIKTVKVHSICQHTVWHALHGSGEVDLDSPRGKLLIEKLSEEFGQNDCIACLYTSLSDDSGNS